MSQILKKLWTEPVFVGAVIVGALNAAIFLPDWKAACASLALSIAGGAVVRRRVTPV